MVAQCMSPTRAGTQPSGGSSSNRVTRSPVRPTTPPTSSPGTAVPGGSSSSSSFSSSLSPPPLSEVKLGWDNQYHAAMATAAPAVGTSCMPPPVFTGNPTAADAGPEGGGGPSTRSAAAAAAAAAVKGGGNCNGSNMNQQPPSAAANGVGAAGGEAEVLRPGD
ncbi:unnamed protein product, partial [Ectocarpus fasciculatus]